MKKFFKYALILFAIDVLLFLLLALKPAPEALTKLDYLKASGTVENVSQKNQYDLVISLDDGNYYYIDQLLTSESETLVDWNTRLDGKAVILYFQNFSTPLDYAENLKRLRILEVEGKEVWTDLKR